MSNPSNISGLTPRPYATLTSLQLPTRAEKRILPSFVAAPTDINAAFSLSAARNPLYEAVLVKIPGRGVNAQGNPDPTQAAFFEFLVNPSTVQVSKQTLDGQSMAKGGWQIGVWGEDFTMVSLQGKTPGQYFERGLTDMMAEYTQSYRNLMALELVIENNGYYFEGEQANEGPLANSALRRNIKMHQDIQLMVGEFIWFGMFDSLSIVQDADSPFTVQFSINFVAWKERYRSGTPYNSVLRNDVQRGQSTQAVNASGVSAATVADSLATGTPSLTGGLTPAQVAPLPTNVTPASSAIQASQGPILVSGGASDSTPTPVMQDSYFSAVSV